MPFRYPLAPVGALWYPFGTIYRDSVYSVGEEYVMEWLCTLVCDVCTGIHIVNDARREDTNYGHDVGGDRLLRTRLLLLTVVFVFDC